jgi:hypothetical protein
MDLDRMSKDIAQLNTKPELQLLVITTPTSFYCAIRIGADEAEVAVNLVENKFVAFRDSLRRWAGMDLKFS